MYSPPEENLGRTHTSDRHRRRFECMIVTRYGSQGRPDDCPSPPRKGTRVFLPKTDKDVEFVERGFKTSARWQSKEYETFALQLRPDTQRSTLRLLSATTLFSLMFTKRAERTSISPQQYLFKNNATIKITRTYTLLTSNVKMFCHMEEDDLVKAYEIRIIHG